MNKNMFAACALSVLLLSPAAMAQESWWSRASQVLNSEAGKQAVGVLTNSQTANPEAGNTQAVRTGETATSRATRNTTGGTGTALSNTDINAGLKEALKVGTQTVVKRLGKEGGYSLDPQIKIPLPAPIARADAMLKTVGMGDLTADLEARMNRAAELAAPKAGALFVNSIQRMTVSDAQAILTGPQDSATQYLRKTMGAELAQQIQPIIQQSLAEAGAVKAYDAVTAQYARIPLASSLKTNMNDYVTNKAIDGLFYYVAQEEAAIRANPAKRSTDILKKVFGTMMN
jgi:hypothetical protein